MRNHFKMLSKYANYTDITVTTAYRSWFTIFTNTSRTVTASQLPSLPSQSLTVFILFFGIISGTCRYIRFSFQNQCIASFGASFYNIIVKLYASSQQKNLRGKNRARKRERQAANRKDDMKKVDTE